MQTGDVRTRHAPLTTLHVVLALFAVVFMTLAGQQRAAQWIEHSQDRPPILWGECLWLGALGYVLPMLLILGAHEAGHLWACAKHRVKASVPYLIPLPLPLTGHGGAYVHIAEPPPSRKALFDIGASGPIAGFLMTLPMLVAGLMLSEPVPLRALRTAARFRMPELMQWIAAPIFGPGVDVVVHPLAWAAWVGLLVTAVNLLPFMSLDGGQIILALWPKWWLLISFVTFAAVTWLAWERPSWQLFLIAMVLMALWNGLTETAVADRTEVGRVRWIVAAVCAVIFAVSVTPIDAR